MTLKALANTKCTVRNMESAGVIQYHECLIRLIHPKMSETASLVGFETKKSFLYKLNQGEDLWPQKFEVRLYNIQRYDMCK